MLLRIEIENFLSFYNKVVFDMFPNPYQIHFKNHIINQQIPLLKQAAIYGENGAGKSNFVKAFAFLKHFIEDKDFLSSINLNRYKFQLTESDKSPIYFRIEFSQNNDYYIYELQINSHITERFFKSGLSQKDNQIIFERNGNSIESDLVTNKESTESLLEKNPNSSILSLNEQFPVLSQSKEISDINNWFYSLYIISINSNIPYLIDMLSKNENLMNFANDVLFNVGITNSLSIKTTLFDEWLNQQDNAEIIKDIVDRSNINNNVSLALLNKNRVEYDFTIEDSIKKVREFIFEQLGINGYKKGLGISYQSDGTVRLLTLIPAFYKAMKQKGIIIIDEIENSMHPNLIYRIVEYFANNESNGQFIFTTHLTKFLNPQGYMTPDELWITEKSNGCTQMRSFNDFKIEDNMNIEKGYQDGRYGGVPSIKQFTTNEQ